jgi:hypothetical protein
LEKLTGFIFYVSGRIAKVAGQHDENCSASIIVTEKCGEICKKRECRGALPERSFKQEGGEDENGWRI